MTRLLRLDGLDALEMREVQDAKLPHGLASCEAVFLAAYRSNLLEKHVKIEAKMLGNYFDGLETFWQTLRLVAGAAAMGCKPLAAALQELSNEAVPKLESIMDDGLVGLVSQLRSVTEKIKNQVAACLPKITANCEQFLMEVFAGMLDEADILKEEIPDPAKLAWGKLHDAFFANNPCKVAYGGGTLTASDVCLCLSYLEDLKQYVSGTREQAVGQNNLEKAVAKIIAAKRIATEVSHQKFVDRSDIVTKMWAHVLTSMEEQILLGLQQMLADFNKEVDKVVEILETKGMDNKHEYALMSADKQADVFYKSAKVLLDARKKFDAFLGE
ncbi:forG, partial [Symbiodinium sp. KB8]